MTEDTMLCPLGLEDKVPDLTLNIYDPQEDAIVEHRLSDYKGKWLIIFFYPADFTFVCPTELKDLHQSYDAIKAANADILVASMDTVFTHKRWVETEGLLKDFGIKMISDRTGVLSDIMGVTNLHTGNSERGTFILSPEGEIKSIEIVTEPIGRSSNELVRKLNALEYVRSNPGQACPASWNAGGKTLTPSHKIAGKVNEQLQ